MRNLIAVLFLLAAAGAVADPLTVGSYPVSPIFGLSSPYVEAPVSTIIDVAHPATATGTVNRASITFSAACSGAFKLAFLRRTASPTTFTVMAVRGPFDAAAGRTDVALSPAVPVQAGDLMAFIQLKTPLTCGGLGFELRPRGDSAIWLSLNDVSTGGTLSANASLDTTMAFAMIAYNADPVLVRVLPAAGAVQGAGAFFRTSVQLVNYSGAPISGKLVFHRAGASGSDSDPSLPFSLNHGQALSFPDVVAAMGTSGLGSLDVFSNGGADLIVSARVFSDAGSAGTSGFTEQGLEPSLARHFPGLLGIMLLPADLTNYRMNVGVRTLESGATLSINTYDANGTQVATRSGVTYPPNYFEQPNLSQFTGVASPPPGGWVRVVVTSGAAFIYGATIDNRTQDSAMRMVELR